MENVHLIVMLNYFENMVVKSLDEIYGDIVYNFRYLRENEMQQFADQSEIDHIFAIHFTTYTTEGGKYIPWIKKQLLAKGVRFIKRHINTVRDLFDEFDIIVNCAGLNGGKVAGDGDDKNMFPIRGIIFEVIFDSIFLNKLVYI
ncbi:unnamed protein product [Wuchereria bancrofti]|uniref:FAD dependent oxidoreductase domain-containing protein n=1 Tax=Wuchereria bancrofti TaxID=6293 RepID=A0A3P7E1U6_WUCBA|nr:unnamed protein product [Wuchereria bancrofti]